MTARPRTLPEALDEAAHSAEGFIFVVNGVEQRRSYADIQQRACCAATALQAVGMRPGDVAALAIDDPEQFLTAFFGASVAGAIPASLAPPALSGGLTEYFALAGGILRAAGAKAVLTTGRLAPRFDALRASCPSLHVVLSHDDLGMPGGAASARTATSSAAPGLDDIAFIQFTSGSSSSPKGVALTHANLSANIEAINGPSGLAATSDDCALSWLPLYHDMGLVGMALGPLYAGRPAVLMTPHAFVKRPADWLKAISRYGATVSFAPNFAYDLVVRRVTDRDLVGLDLSRWRIAGCGAEPIHAPTLAAFADRLAPAGFRSASFFPCYGLAEHVLAATLPPRERAPRVHDGLVSCGAVLPDHRLRIVRDDGTEATAGEVGEITLSGPSVMHGYYNNPASTAETVRDGWLHSGDLGYIESDELFVCGRAGDTIVANGRKFHPQDLEWAVEGVAGARRGRAVAFGVPRPGSAGGADRVVIVVEGSAEAAEGLTAAIRRRVSDVFGLYVDDVRPVPSGTIGRTTSGKVRRAAVRAWYQQHHGSSLL
jgi:fatty-acyl-CoA synthase